MTRLYAINTADVRMSRWFFYQKPGRHLLPFGFAPFERARDMVWCPCLPAPRPSLLRVRFEV